MGLAFGCKCGQAKADEANSNVYIDGIEDNMDKVNSLKEQQNPSKNNFLHEKTGVKENEKLKGIKFDKSDFIHMKNKSLFEEYDILERLGEGSYGQVYKTRHKVTGNERAVKALKRKHVDGNAFSNEIDILKKVDHPNIIRLYDCFYDNNYYYMVEEYCPDGDLYEYIREQKFFSEKKAAQVLYQLLSATNYLHKLNIVHRDLKPENIVFIKTNNQKHDKNEEIYIKLIDFGTSVHLAGAKLTQELGTIYYIAPEVFKNNYNEKADIWSIGIILYIMLCGHPPFLGKREEDIKNKILNNPLPFGNEFSKVSKEAIEFVKELLTYDQEKRPSAQDALKNKWLNEQRVSEHEVNLLEGNAIENLSKFSSTLTLQKATLSFLANQISMNDEINRLKDEFDKIDINKDGQIDEHELAICFQAMYSKEEAEYKAKEAFKSLDFNGDGSLSFSEFITARMEKAKLCSEEMLKKAFDIFDLDGNGSITMEELRETMPLEILDNSQWAEIIKEVDTDGNGELNFSEFKEMMEKLAVQK